MKKLSTIFLKSLLILSIWVAGLYLFASYRIDHSGVDTQFPYYNILLTKVQNSKEAVWAYFDGTHYVRLAENGYVDTGTQAFFPVYPALVRVVKTFTHLPIVLSGQIISLFFLLLSIILIHYLFPGSVTKVLLWTLLFPTSFFFATVYTESLFLFETLLFFFLLTQKKYLPAAIVAGFAGATRLVGVFLTLSLLIELVRARVKPLTYLLLLVSLSGFLGYSFFLYYQFGDPLMFLHVQGMFGGERSSDKLILLPQVIFRYLKMIFTVDPTSPLYPRLWLELTVFAGIAWVWFKNLKIIPLSHSVFIAASLILPTLTGTLSSVPRYALVLVPLLVGSRKFSLLSLLLLLYFFWVYIGGAFVA